MPSARPAASQPRPGPPAAVRPALAVVLAALLVLAGSALGLAPAGAVTTHAIRDLDLCTQHALPRNDDGSSDLVPLPFPINFFGTRHEALYVNNNGNVTFDAPLVQYTPEDLTGPTGRPMVAPFFADIDTRGAGSAVTTYGWDASTFCVSWVGVGFYNSRADKLVSAQLVITDRSAATGSEGDVRLELNYSDIGWETGSASGGVDGFGGTSVAVGYTAGTGEPGTFTQFTGSLVNGALVDGGPNALTASSRNSDVLGRYVFDIGGADLVQEGAVVGLVTGPDGAPLDVGIRVCPDEGECVRTTTGADGRYSVVGLPVGEYTVVADPGIASGLAAAAEGATVRAGAETVVDFALAPFERGTLEVIVVDLDGAHVIGAAVRACETSTGLCTDMPASDEIGSSIVDPLPAGEYTVWVDAPAGSRLLPASAAVTVGSLASTHMTVVLPPVTDREISGVVVGADGEPVPGATVTLAAAVDGVRVPVPSDSPLLAPGSENPRRTGADGRFAWTTAAGEYHLEAAAPGCAPAGVAVDARDDDGADVRLVLECVEPTTPPTPEPTETPTTPTAPLGSTPPPPAPPTPPGGDRLPDTGAAPAALAPALLALLGGAVLVAASRRSAMLGR